MQESASKEANRQKWLYDRKVGAVELRPKDCVLVCLDAFRGQCRKLKNRWGDDIHTMIDQKADSIPVYEVKNERTGKRKVLHRARLLLWLADYGEPVTCNLMMISNTLPGMVPGQQLEDSGEGLHPVPGDSLQYGLDLTHYMAIIDNLESMMSHIGCKVCMAYLDRQRVIGFRLIVGKSQTRTLWAPTWETSRLVEWTETIFAPTIVFGSTQILGGGNSTR